jgi:hypothetical protein
MGGEVVERTPGLILSTGYYPSVTRVLDLVPKPFLIPWAAKIQREGAVLLSGETTHSYRDIQSQSQEVGKATHALVAAELSMRLPVGHSKSGMTTSPLR